MLTSDERLALLKAVTAQAKPKLDELTAQARNDLMGRYAKDGTDRRAILANGQKVGEVGISYSNPKPFIYADREEEALDFLEERGLVERSPAKGWEKHFAFVAGKVVCTDTGEEVEWAGWQAKEPKSADVRGCKPQEVLEAIAPKLQGQSIFALLEG